jgi:predicted nucleic acid-binding protein
MTDRAFIDTNLAVYAYVENDRDKHRASFRLLGEMLVKKDIYISTQVLHEFYVVLTRYKRTHAEITGYIREITRSANVKAVSLATVEKCLQLKEKYGFSYWDSLILASALECGCTLLFTEDLQHNQIIEGSLRIRNPFMNANL